jgi:hypothetical protein
MSVHKLSNFSATFVKKLKFTTHNFLISLARSHHLVHTSSVFTRALVNSTDVTQPLSNFHVTLRTHLRSASARASFSKRCHTTSLKLSGDLAHTSLFFTRALVNSTDVTQPLSNFHVTLCTHLRSASARASFSKRCDTTSQTFSSPCARISLHHTRACQLDRCHTTSLKLSGDLAHTPFVMACRLVNSTDVTQPLSNFHVTLRTHLRLDMSAYRF